MRRISLLPSLLWLALLASAQAQDAKPSADEQAMLEAMQKAAAVGSQHRQLQALAGDWDVKSSFWMDPAAPPMTETGKARNTLVLGGRFLRSEFAGQMMGGPFEGLGYTGYDNRKGRYYVTWMDTASTGVLIAWGDYDSAKRSYTYRADLPDPLDPAKTSPIREVLRIVDADHHVLEWYETRNGAQIKTMQVEYARAGR